MLPDLPPPVLEVFYLPSCAPCRLELPALAELIVEGRTVRIVIVDQEERSRADLRAVSPRLEAVAIARTAADPRQTLREAGNDTGILPFARGVNGRGEACSRWWGGLTVARARGLLEPCLRQATLPWRSRS